MTVRWFRGSSGQKTADRLRLRKTPKAPKTPKPKTPGKKHDQRSPKLDQPVVEVPFGISPSPGGKTSQQRKAVVHGSDSSRFRLQTIDSVSPIVSITWNLGDLAGEGETGWMVGRCDGLHGTVWGSLDDFLGSMEYDDGQVGIWGHSHPNCNCHLDITTEDGSMENVTTMG